MLIACVCVSVSSALRIRFLLREISTEVLLMQSATI